MAELAHGTQPEFWRPPSPRLEDEVLVQEYVQTRAEVCLQCGTEFLLGSRFCHTCGTKRPESLSPSAKADAAAMANLWERGIQVLHSTVAAIPWRRLRFPDWLHHLHFHEVKERTGLSTGSLIAFVIGLACVAGALLVGLLTAKNLVEWQAIQFYRAEWLLAATVSFVAGILLKKHSHADRD